MGYIYIYIDNGLFNEIFIYVRGYNTNINDIDGYFNGRNDEKPRVLRYVSDSAF